MLGHRSFSETTVISRVVNTLDLCILFEWRGNVFPAGRGRFSLPYLKMGGTSALLTPVLDIFQS